jgi:hypothetical protein
MTDTAAPATPAPASRYAAARPKVPAFARFKGTSAWKKDPRRARAYAAFLAAAKKA